MKVEFDIDDAYFDEVERAENLVVLLGTVDRRKRLTMIVGSASPADYEEVRVYIRKTIAALQRDEGSDGC